MEAKTLIAGKDAPLEETIDSARTRLSAIGIEVTASNWLNPAPNCWSVHLQATRCPSLCTNGKGTSRKACLASGLGEFLERLSTDFFFAEYCLENHHSRKMTDSFSFFPDEAWFAGDAKTGGDFPTHNHDGRELLTTDLRDYYNPEGELRFEHLLDNNLDYGNMAICALPFIDINTGARCYFPISILNNLYVSNGMAAGNTPAECDSQALSEILERYVKNIVISKGIALPDVPDKRLQSFPVLQTIINALNQKGFLIKVKDGSLGGKYPVICVLLIDADSGGLFAAFGCNCRFETAVERTLTELLQGRTLHEFHKFHSPVHDLNLVAEPYNLENHFIDSNGLLGWSMLKSKPDFAYFNWDFKGSTQEELQLLRTIVMRDGLTIYRAQYTHCGMYTCRIIIPQMSEIYPIDDLIWNNRNIGAEMRPALLNLPHMDMAELEGFAEKLDELGLGDHQLISDVIGILFDTDSAWASLRIGELKALIYLVLQDHHKSYQWCNWCIEFGELPRKRKHFYRVLQTLLGFRIQGEIPDDYDSILSHLFEKDTVLQAVNVIEGKTTFPGLVFEESWSKVSSSHKELLNLYDLLYEIKKRGGHEFDHP